MAPIAVSRRLLLAAAAGAGAAAVTGCAATPGRSAPAAEAIGGDDLALARRTADLAAALAADLEATARRHAGVRTLVDAMAARHRAHVRAFVPDDEPLRDPRPTRVTGSTTAALRALVAAQQRAAASTRRAALAASSGDLARALAAAAACMAQHEWLLTAELDTRAGRS